MSDRWRTRLVCLATVAVCAVSFLTGINWGLPSRAADAFLFGARPIWSGAEIERLAPSDDDRLGADVDANPLVRRNEPVVLNQTDAQRAEIVRRYRLFSAQPDEMITFKSLARIRQFKGDPRLYQYGGLWVYPVGVLLKLSSLIGLVALRADRAFYLDHPEAFGRFYVVARLYVVSFGLAGAWAVFWLARRWTAQSCLVAASAVVCYAMLPVVNNMAHEAKPHLPAAVLILLAVIAATKYVDHGLRRWWVLAAVLCGAAAGMVISAITSLILLPVMAWLRRPASVRERLVVTIASLLIAVDVYFLTNPFVLIHLLGDRAFLMSNLGNSAAMYRTPASLGGLWNAAWLIGIGATPLLAIVGAGGAVASGLAARRKGSRDPAAMMLGAVSLVVLVQFALLATGKPAEYARFALLPAIALMLAAVCGLSRRVRAFAPRAALLGAMCAVTSLYGVSYIWHFARDATPRPTRLIAAERLSKLLETSDPWLRIQAEPAPYSLPPLDLFKWMIILDPAGWYVSSPKGVTISTVDNLPPTNALDGVTHWFRPRLLQTPISWASKPFRVVVKSSKRSPAAGE